MRILLFSLFILVFNTSFSQEKLNEDEIKTLAEEIDQKMSGTTLQNGVVMTGCTSIMRRLVYSYEVPENWEISDNAKEEIIMSLREAEAHKMYVSQEIDVAYLYFHKGNSRGNVWISWEELSSLNMKLGPLYTGTGHPKSKGLEWTVRFPDGWEVKEADRPNIVQKAVYEGNTFMVMVLNTGEYISKDDARHLISDDEYQYALIEGLSERMEHLKIIDQDVTVIDSQPAYFAQVEGEIDSPIGEIKTVSLFYSILYKDKTILLQGGYLADDENKFKLELLFKLFATSFVIQEQWRY